MKILKHIKTFFSPNWRTITVQPLNINFELDGELISTQKGKVIVQKNDAGEIRYRVEEPDGRNYVVPAKCFSNWRELSVDVSDF